MVDLKEAHRKLAQAVDAARDDADVTAELNKFRLLHEQAVAADQKNRKAAEDMSAVLFTKLGEQLVSIEKSYDTQLNLLQTAQQQLAEAQEQQAAQQPDSQEYAALAKKMEALQERLSEAEDTFAPVFEVRGIHALHSSMHLCPTRRYTL